jgi:choice-of-anchor A domain-containing protein
MWRTSAVGCTAVVLLALALLTGRSDAAPPTARAAACDSLGAADRFAVFSDGPFTAAAGAGTSITGRIAAKGDVTVDGVSISPGPNDATPTVVTGGSFIGGRTTGQGGTLNGGVRYADALDLAPNFTVNGDRIHDEPPFSFDDEFTNLALISDTWAQREQTAGATVTLQPWGALELRGPNDGLNVFTIDAADITAAQIQGVTVTLPSATSTALINVTTNTDLTFGPQYLNVSPAGIEDQLIWNLPRATRLHITTAVAWKGLVLAPHATVEVDQRTQLAGQLIAASVPRGDIVVTGMPLATCPPVEVQDTSLTLEALCVDPFGNLAMRLRNTGDSDRDVHWDDLGGSDFGDFTARAQRDQFFNVRGGGADSRVRVSAGSTTLTEDGTDTRCEGEITVTKAINGPAPFVRWTIELAGADGNAVRSAQLLAGESVTFDALGGYEPGSAQFGQVVGGVVYTVREDDTHGGTATISLNPVQILTGQHERVVVTNHFAPIDPTDPEQPTLPPGSPDPPDGPDLGGVLPGVAAADLELTHTIRPRRGPADSMFRVRARVRNLGTAPAVGTVLRELPQLRKREERRLADVVSARSTKGRCTQSRPLRCTLGRLEPGASVVLRGRVRINRVAVLRSVAYVSSRSPEDNTTNNTSIAPVTTTAGSRLRARVTAPATTPIGERFPYEVAVTNTSRRDAQYVRLCAPPSARITGVRAAGTIRYRRARCVDIRRLRPGRTVSFTVSAIPTAYGRLHLTARATMVGRSGAVRDRTQVLVPRRACPARALAC